MDQQKKADREWVNAELESMHAEMRRVTAAKGADYCGGAVADPFSNFRRVEMLGIATTEQGMLTRITDKLSRLASLCQPGAVAQVKDESIEDTALDGANYLMLFVLYRRAKAKGLLA